jgi:hypothetical protein
MARLVDCTIDAAKHNGQAKKKPRGKVSKGLVNGVYQALKQGFSPFYKR